MLNSGSGRHRRHARVEHGTETNESSGGSLLGAASYAHDGHGTANPTRVPPQYDDSPGQAASRSPTACIEVIGQAPGVVMHPGDADPVYFYTESYPFAVEQFDLRKEKDLGMAPAQLPSGGADVPTLNADNCRQLKLGGEVPAAGSLRSWDKACLEKHLGAITRSIATPEELNNFVLMKDETPLHFLRLAGVSDAPGLNDDVAQRCCMAFTNKGRLIFTQDKHSADVGIPTMNCCNSFLPCFLDKWSRRTWTSYYVSVHASDILQVFVQQTLTTNYHSFGCAYHDICSELCVVGGSLQTDKDIEGAIQTMGDHDPEGFVKNHDKTRRMRHALVVRYVDCATNSVRQTVALAHPDTPASELYEMARSIEAKITLRSADWFKFKSIPTPLAANAFRDLAGMTPFLKRRSFKIGLFMLLIVALGILAVNVAAALAMIFAVLFSFGTSYCSLAKTAKTGTSAGYTLLASQGLAGLIYVISLLVVISESMTSSSSSSTSSSANYTYYRY